MSSLFMLASISHVLGSYWVPIMGVFIVLAVLGTARVMASRYIKIGPTEAGIFYGMRGYKVVTGGGKFLYPIVQKFQLMSTAATQVKIDEKDIPNKDNVKISARGVATFKIDTTNESLNAAAASFLGKSDEDISIIVSNILQGHLRSIIGKMDINEILRDRDAFNKKVIEESSLELQLMGVKILNMVITEVADVHGYIDALGKRAVADAIADADIKTAQAQASAKKQVSDAQREAEITVANNAVKIASAVKDRDVQTAEYKVTAENARAAAEKAFEIATAKQEETLKVAQAARDAAEKKAQVEVQQQEASRREQELIAQVVRPAEAAKRKQVIDAEAAKQQQILQAEAAKQQQILAAEATKESQTNIGLGEAAKAKAIGEGQAAATKATLTAAAEGAAAQKGLVLKAEAEGTQKLAEALAKMTDSAKLILVLDRMPLLLDKGGDAAEKALRAIFESTAAPFGNIDKVTVNDFGGSGKALESFGTLVPKTVANVLATLSATGIDVKGIMKKLGVNIDSLEELLDLGDNKKKDGPKED